MRTTGRSGMAVGGGVPLYVVHQTSEQIEAAIRRVLAGDIDAYALVVTGFEQLVWGVVAQILGDRDETEELVQRVFVHAYEHLDRYTQGTDFAAWIVTLARNLSRNHLRDTIREHHRRGSLREHLIRHLGDDRAWERDERELLDALATCQSALNDESRDLLRLHYQDAVPLHDIALRLQRSTSGIERMLVRLRLTLRDCIMDKVTE